MWSAHRETMNKVLICLLYISTLFGLTAVVLTILLLIHMGSFVNDADDYLYFMTLNPHQLVDVAIIVCLLGGSIAIPLAAVVGNEVRPSKHNCLKGRCNVLVGDGATATTYGPQTEFV